MKRLLPALVAILLASSSLNAPARGEETGTLMAETARRFLGSLDDAQRDKATFGFDDPERLNWHWIPRPRKGLPIKELASDQRVLAFALLNTGLSNRGMVTAATTMSYEEIIREEEHENGTVRNPELYFISVFGTPGEGSWGWRWEGHHLALNFTLSGDKVVSATPFMLGANPAKVASGPRKGLRNLAAIQDPIYALVASLDEGQRKAAIVSEEVPDVTTTPNAPKPPAPEALGIDIGRLNPEQHKLLGEALKAYLETFPAEIGGLIMEQLHAGGKPEAHLAWYGPIDPSKAHAFRIQGPTVLIDFNDKQNGANHIHTFFRTASGDFGLPAAK
ncbi:DUF3500 domain-containing protein [Paludisphaera mucosa]|uniref:DUF3500 domain-containing protein n=1 Tax=Paludisphaera mucosa TaxID=3030827 RepID=A0ABT6F777_9BACT|nr:DUF3500 domain-containing protein [Paludisphaera mucosa]MDG3003414.1 DUF3500 domain-containing protein [Paludisphaera mucosa]